MDSNPNISFDFLPDNLSGIYLVGGGVRDAMMGNHPSDIDLVVQGDIRNAAGWIADRIGGKVVDLGKKGFRVLRVAAADRVIDIAPLTQGTIEDDLRQRDFTINAMAYDLRQREVVDCTGGRMDLEKKRIRIVSPSALEKDPARLVRAFRMLTMFGFSIADDTRDAIARTRHLVKDVAGERIWTELIKIFDNDDSFPIINQMAGCGLLTEIFPELVPTIGCSQNRHHAFDVFDHALFTYKHVEALIAGTYAPFAYLTQLHDIKRVMECKATIKYSTLLHDVGKPATRITGEKGAVRFPGHAARGADIAASASHRLRLSRRQRTAAHIIIRNHIRPLSLYLADRNRTLRRRGMVRFFNHCGLFTFPVIIHAMADILAKKKDPLDDTDPFLEFCHRLIRIHGEVSDQQAAVLPLIDGDDLIKLFGLRPSPIFKQILQRVDERRLSGDLTTRTQALRWVDAYLARCEEKTVSSDDM